MVQFTNPAVAAKYKATRSTDGKVHVPAGKEKTGGYAGLLSGITLAAADKAFASKSNILELKDAKSTPIEVTPTPIPES